MHIERIFSQKKLHRPNSCSNNADRKREEKSGEKLGTALGRETNENCRYIDEWHVQVSRFSCTHTAYYLFQVQILMTAY